MDARAGSEADPIADIERELDRARDSEASAVSLEERARARGYAEGLGFTLDRLRPRTSRDTRAEAGERARTGESLRDLYESIVRSAPDVIAITALDAKILMVSQSVEKMFGWTEEELVGRSITDFIVSQDRERAHDRIDLMFRGIMTGPGEYRGIQKNGGIFTIEVNAEIIRDTQRRPSKLVFIIRNVS